MSSGELLSIHSDELIFPFELKKQFSNLTDHYIAFKIKTTNPKKYYVRPNTGVVLPRATSDVVVTMQAQREASPDMQCKDKFLLQSVVANPGATQKDITAEMECKLRVVYVSPPQPPSPVSEGSDEGSSPRASFSENGIAAGFERVTRKHIEFKDKNSEARAMVSRLTEEKKSVIQLNKNLHQELEFLRKQSRSLGGYPFVYVVLVSLLGILIGYLMWS